MALLEWRAEFSVGVAAIDHEHREMIELINAAYQALTGSDSETAVADCLGEIYTKIAAHFALEEKLMREHRYDHYEAHKADHERLLDEIRDIMDDYDDRRYFDPNDLGARLQGWFSQHFRTMDVRLHRALQA